MTGTNTSACKGLVAWALAWTWLALLPALALAALPERISYGEPGSWVEVLDASEVAPQASLDGIAYRLVDDQLSLLAEQPVEYRRLVYDVADRGGLEEAGRIRISFHPEYQQVVVHALGVVRDGLISDRRQGARVELLRLEKRADQGILDGRRTAEFLISDVQVGDRIDVAFSIIGTNPVFGRAHHTRFNASYGQAIGLRRVRAVVPGGAPLKWRQSGPEYQVSDTLVAGRRILTLEARPLPAMNEPAGTPAWHDSFGVIEMSTATDWAEVARWAVGLFQPRSGGQRALADQARSLALPGMPPAEALDAALAFVQQEVRYVSLSMGESSHAPADPALTLSRRFGDCKDKSLLLVGLLGEAGVEAEVVLVNSRLRHATRDRLPSPIAFDHAIVRARVDGTWIYADPTRDLETGARSDRAPVVFGVGLPVGRGVGELVEITAARLPEAGIEVLQHVTMVGDAGDVRAEMRVATKYRYGHASGSRSRFRASGPESIGKDYLSYMQGWYRDIDQVSPPEPEDLPESNGFVVREHYQTPFTPDADNPGAIGELELRLFQLADWVPQAREAQRTHPLALVGPERGVHEIRMNVAGGWDIKTERHEVANDFFEFTRSVEAKGDELVIRGEWHRLAEEIPPEAYAGLRAELHQARDLLDYTVLIGGGGSPGLEIGSDGLAWTGAGLLALVLVLVGLWPARKVNRVAGMVFAPVTTTRLLLPDASIHGAFLLLLGAGLVSTLVALVPELVAGASPRWGRLVLEAIAVIPQTLLFVGLLLLAFRLLGSRPRYRDLLVASAWAAWPMLLMFPIALLAGGPALALIADDAAPAAGEMGIWLTMLATVILILLVGLFWTFATAVGATAAAAGSSLGRSLGANLLVMACVFLIALAIVVGYLLTTGDLPDFS